MILTHRFLLEELAPRGPVRLACVRARVLDELLDARDRVLYAEDELLREDCAADVELATRALRSIQREVHYPRPIA
jgi:hypothetical protein